MKMICKEFLADESGATAIEYSLIAGVIAVVLIAAFGSLGDALSALFSGNEGSISAAMGGS